VLGDIRLAPAERGFKVTDTGFAFSDCEQDGNALRWRNSSKGCRDFFCHLRERMSAHIHNPEYIIPTYSII
jgi:hypothetical protein